MSKVYDYVTERIIKRMQEEKIAPWQKPWIGDKVNYVTQEPYRGVNILLLNKSGEYLTFKQIKEKGGHLKKGSKSEMVIFFKMIEKGNKDSREDAENKEKYAVLRYYNVYHLDNVEGVESKYIKKVNTPIEEVEKIIQGYKNSPKMYESEKNRAYYNKNLDIINMPTIDNHVAAEKYYSVKFHEMIHSTGHKSRLKRFKDNETVLFGDEIYSKEELIAEIGAAMLCGVSGIVNKTIENSVSYLDSWIKQLKNDKTLIVKAAAQAQKASDYILGKVENKENPDLQNCK